ncbi:primosomal protein N' [Romeria aff. gracilis LEGE 07310]|uniref:Replication restart protein PriA n=2 Tax=Vasconcelosia TaxID=3366328 RepID=A0A8J7DMQ1_9CYAN|nr:primosomal protein N' [Romeria aff. gracilis LEGE 07310]
MNPLRLEYWAQILNCMAAKSKPLSPEWIEVLVDCPGAQGLYTYRIPPALAVTPGDILSVPFNSQQLGAIAVRYLTQPDLNLDLIKPVEAVISTGFFSSSYWQLLDRIAEYYQTPLMQVIRTALPPGLLARSQRRIRLKPAPSPPATLLSASAQSLLAHLHQSTTGDYTWQYLQRQQRGAHRALQELLRHGWVESYLAPPQTAQPQKRQVVTLTAKPADESLSQRQQEILTGLQRQGGELWLSDALQLLQTTSATLKRLAAKGYLSLEAREVLRVGSHSTAAADQPKTLTAAQTQALAQLNQLEQYVTALLHGVTGSGKTEVYLQAIAPRLNCRQSALVLVPEIGLTSQLTDRFRSRFGERVCLYHSGLSDGERYDTWRQMLSGEPQVVIGTRSAIFVPLSNLGLIVLDEEHDSSFKQDQPAPCYHTRTVARWRAQQANCPLVLGSATPALETWVEVQSSRDSQGQRDEAAQTVYLSLPSRIHNRPHPPIQIIDMRQELQAGNRSIFSRSLEEAIAALPATGGQGILFIHRRGHSSFVSCRSCGYVMECPNCDVSLSYHQPHDQAEPYLRCHYCNHYQSHPSRCPECASPYLKNFGSGTQRVVSEIAKQFPTLRCLRFDSDTTRRKGSHRALLTRFAQGEADLLVGTQMLTKGIDLPQVTLVGIVAADGLLYMPDYWASERAFQMMTQVAGRAGRGERAGQVIVQTYTPEHPAVQAVQQQDYAAFTEAELQDRQALGYPPYGRLILLRVTSPDPIAVKQAAEDFASKLEAIAAASDCDILGPAPAPILRVARRYRWQILLKLPLSALISDLSCLRQHCPDRVSLTIDVDPLNLS